MTAAILYRAEEENTPELVKQVLKTLQERGMETVSKGYVDRKLTKKEEPKEGFYYRNQLNWLGLPGQEVVQELTQKPVDVAIEIELLHH